MNIIVAASENNAIGNKGTMPWHLNADLRYLRQTTMGHAVIMGRKTYESIGKPLPGRRNIVVTRNADFQISAEALQQMGMANLKAVDEGKPQASIEVYDSLEEALKAAPADAFIMGGAQIYNQAWQQADAIYLTRVHTTIGEFDASIPAIPEGYVCETVAEAPADEKNDYPVTFEIWRKSK